MKVFYKNILGAVLVLFAVALIFSALSGSFVEPLNLTFSQLVEKINQGDVQGIIVSGEKLDIELKSGAKAVAQKESGVGLSETLKNYGVESEQLKAISLEIKDESGFRFWAGLILPILLPVLIIIFVFLFIIKQAKMGASQAMTFGKSGIRLFASKGKEKVTFNDVAGLEESKQELQEVVEFLKQPKKFLNMGAKIPRGVLLIGPPGSGKTLLARAVAGESNVPFFSISASEFVEMFVGVGAARTRDAFATAKKSAPAILFIDEIDAVGRQRGSGLGGGHDEREQTLNQILVELDGFERDTRVIVLAATNRPDILDAALLRPGRFDRRIVLDLPDLAAREKILAIHTKDKPLSQTVDLKKVAIRTPGFSGADLANLMNEAAILAARDNQKQITQHHLYESVEKVMLGPERRNRAISKKEREITAYHEAGHALVAASLKDADPIHKISIVSRGLAGGYTLKLPLQENRLRTRSQFLTDLAMMLGGYASEEVVFGDISTGASSDLRKASDLARDLITKYGMSKEIGPVAFGSGEEVFLGKELLSHKNYSESVASKIDEEIHHFIDSAYETAKKIISSRQKVLKEIADTLLEKEVLEGDEFKELLKPFRLKKLSI